MFLPLALLLAAAPPPASKASALVASKQWEELYLAFASAQPSAYGKADQQKLAKALAAGCVALVPDDAVMAYSLGEKSAAFAATQEGLYCAGLAALRTDQRASAEEHFRAGMKAFPKDARFPLELGRFLLEEGDAPGATQALAKVPAKAKEYQDAQALLARARGNAEPPPSDVAIARAPSPKTISPARDDAEEDELPGQRRGPPAPIKGGGVTGMGYESSVDGEGRRVRANSYFRFRYFNAQRDFGQRADYEGRVQGALEESRRASQRLLGFARENPVDVILYSREEFLMHHGPQAAMAIAGFYSASAIRMNDSAEINAHNQATLVHEYIHAVVDELTGFNDGRLPVWINEGLAEYIEWRYQGSESPAVALSTGLRQLASQGKLPPLGTMTRGPLIGMRNPALAYALSATAVKLLAKKGGMTEVVELIRDAGKGEDFDKAFERRFGKTLEEFDEELAAELKAR